MLKRLFQVMIILSIVFIYIITTQTEELIMFYLSFIPLTIILIVQYIVYGSFNPLNSFISFK